MATRRVTFAPSLIERDSEVEEIYEEGDDVEEVVTQEQFKVPRAPLTVSRTTTVSRPSNQAVIPESLTVGESSTGQLVVNPSQTRVSRTISSPTRTISLREPVETISSTRLLEEPVRTTTRVIPSVRAPVFEQPLEVQEEIPIRTRTVRVEEEPPITRISRQPIQRRTIIEPAIQRRAIVEEVVEEPTLCFNVDFLNVMSSNDVADIGLLRALFPQNPIVVFYISLIKKNGYGIQMNRSLNSSLIGAQYRATQVQHPPPRMIHYHQLVAQKEMLVGVDPAEGFLDIYVLVYNRIQHFAIFYIDP